MNRRTITLVLITFLLSHACADEPIESENFLDDTGLTDSQSLGSLSDIIQSPDSAPEPISPGIADTGVQSPDADLEKNCPAGANCTEEPCEALNNCSPELPTGLCRPCSSSEECSELDPSAQCIDYGPEGAFCGLECETSEICSAGFTCTDSLNIEGDAVRQCTRTTGICACSEEAIANAAMTRCFQSNDFGSCEGTRTCTDEGLSPCDARVPAADTCNGIDDDCDGILDTLPCDDLNSCTEDSCGGEAGCIFDALPGKACDDGNPNTTNDTCNGFGACAGAPIACSPTQCEESSTPDGDGCTPTFKDAGVSCDDSNPATKNDQCDGNGQCSGTSYSCTPGTCESASTPNGTGCTPSYKAAGANCDDGKSDTKNDQCDGSGICSGSGYSCSPSQCESSSSPNGSGCTPTYKPNGASCNDGKNNTKNDKCNGSGTCSGTSYSCTPGQCESSSSPNGSGCTPSYKPSGADCNDGNPGTNNDQCNGQGSCSGVAAGTVDPLSPCTNGSCWHPSITAGGCSTQVINEDYSSGSYNVHAYSVSVSGFVPMEISFKRTAGTWQPGIIVGSSDGATFYDGQDGSQAGYFNIDTVKTGKTGDTAKIEIYSVVDVDLIIYVTGWHVIDGNFNPSITTSAKYRLTASNVCAPGAIQDLSPCTNGSCWNTSVSALPCAGGAVPENFSSGAYNVHAYSTSISGGSPVLFNLSVTGGSWQPALVIQTAAGATIYDGKIGMVMELTGLEVKSMAFGTSGSLASVEITSGSDMDLVVYVTSWDTVNGDFVPGIPTNATYILSAVTGCDTLLSPPNFNASDVVDGYYILPPPSPSDLYTYNGAKPCSRGHKLLIDVIYTVATQWKAKYGATYGSLNIGDLNEAPGVAGCDGDHASHTGGVYADVSVQCGTKTWCSTNQPAIDLATMFINTGVMCVIIYNKTAIHNTINSYFGDNFDYAPTYGSLMYSYQGHDGHFHIKIKNPDGTCVNQ